MAQSREISSLDLNGVSTFSNIAGKRHREGDEQILARLGKRQILKVNSNIKIWPFIPF